MRPDTSSSNKKTSEVVKSIFFNSVNIVIIMILIVDLLVVSQLIKDYVTFIVLKCIKIVKDKK